MSTKDKRSASDETLNKKRTLSTFILPTGSRYCEVSADLFLYTHHILHVSPSWERDFSSAALPEGFFRGSFSRSESKGRRTECVQCCSECKRPLRQIVISDSGSRK